MREVRGGCSQAPLAVTHRRPAVTPPHPLEGPRGVAGQFGRMAEAIGLAVGGWAVTRLARTNRSLTANRLTANRLRRTRVSGCSPIPAATARRPPGGIACAGIPDRDC